MLAPKGFTIELPTSFFFPKELEDWMAPQAARCSGWPLDVLEA